LKLILVCVAILLEVVAAGCFGDWSGSRVPLFVQQGEVIKVDTRTGEYISRVKNMPNEWQPTCSIDMLRLRAQVLNDIRQFFQQEQCLK